MTIKFCPNCGSSVTFKIPEGDKRKRYCCENCNEIIYQNPKIVAGCIAHVEKKKFCCVKEPLNQEKFLDNTSWIFRKMVSQ